MATQTSVKVASLTGAAKDDVLTSDITGLTQNKLTGNLNVLLNDPGSAKLYSLIQDPSALASTATLPVVNSITLASGAKISINADGTIAYDASTLHTPLQSLAQGENYTDTFVYTIRMANGALSTAKVSVLIAGVNDAPTLTSVTPLSPTTLNDTASWDTPAAITGKVTGADIDHGAVLSYSIASGGQSLTNDYGTLTIDAATGNYSFVADAAKFNSLAAGENATATFSVLVKDEHGAASAPVTLNFKLTGANDTATIDGNGTGGVAEDGTLGASGKLNVHDADHGQAAFQAPASLAGTYGDFTFNSATGDWSYTLRNGDANVQALNAGKVVSDEITVTSVDGTATAKLHVDVTGANDAASISGNANGGVTEDGTLGAAGAVTVSDVDTGEAVFKDPGSLHGTYGDFSFDKATGQWSYALRNGDANVQALNAGKVVADEVTVTSADGTASATLHVDITGTNDAASISGNGNGAVGEDAVLGASGTVVVADVDSGEAVFQAPASLAGTYGDFSFNKDTGEWSYTLRNGDANVQALNAGKVVSDEITVTSSDGTANTKLHVDITGANDAASISGNGNGGVTEDGTLGASGTLTVSDVDTGEAVFKDPASLHGTYGDFSFDKSTGQWSYALRNGDANVQALNAGKVVSDEITVTSADGTATAKLHVDVTGTNDAASISGNGNGGVTEDGTLGASGTLTVSDVDTGEAVFKDPASLHGTYGDFSFDKSTGQWSYALRNGDANVQALNAGKVVADEITVTSADGTASATLHVDVTGTNDAASISGNGNGAVGEDGILGASGTLTVSDVDTGEAVFKDPASLHGTYGDFSFDKSTGQWSYALRNGDANVQALNAGKVVADEITVTSADGTATAKLHVDVTGANDAASISGNGSGAVGEDATLGASGTLVVADVDSGEAVFQAPASLAGTYGDFSFNKDTGEWSYTLRNGDANVQALNAGKVVSDEITVTSSDGTASAKLHVDVTGANDAASISGNGNGAVGEDGVLGASGAVTVADVDSGEAVFKAPDSLAGTYGDFSFNKDTGAWSYALRNGDANVQALNAGKVVSDEITVTSADGTASTKLHVDITGANDAASISGNGNGAVGEDAVLAASGKLAVTDPDSGEAAFKAPATLAGTYGDFTLNTSTGDWSYLLRNGDANVQALNAGKVVADEITVTSLDGSASTKLHVDITGANDTATIGGTNTGAVSEDNVLSASGTLTVTDPDAGEAGFQAPSSASLTGTYGNFTFDKATGAWSYALRNADANVQALNSGQVVSDKLVVSSLDGSASNTITVNVAGADEPNPVTIFQANHGQTDINGKVVFNGFDYNDQLVYASNYTYSGYTVSDYNGDGKQDSIVHLTYTSNGGKADLYVVLLGISTLAPGQVHVST